MIPKIASILFILPLVVAFRAPDNIQKDVILPIIQTTSSTVAPPKVVPEPPAPATRGILGSDISIQRRQATERKKWRVDKENENDYWYKYVNLKFASRDDITGNTRSHDCFLFISQSNYPYSWKQWFRWGRSCCSGANQH
jgi:hypothetical protein